MLPSRQGYTCVLAATVNAALLTCKYACFILSRPNWVQERTLKWYRSRHSPRFGNRRTSSLTCWHNEVSTCAVILIMRPNLVASLSGSTKKEGRSERIQESPLTWLNKSGFAFLPNGSHKPTVVQDITEWSSFKI